MSDSAKRRRPLKTYSGAVKRALSKDEETGNHKRTRVEDELPAVTVTKPKLGATLDGWLCRNISGSKTASSVPSSDDTLLSDRQDRSTPPSSPPPLQVLRPYTASAKLRQSQTGNDETSDPLREIDSNAATDNSHRYSKTRDRVVKAQMIQMQINLGKDLQKTCKDCGMTYVISDADDVALHDKFHARDLLGIDLGRAFRSFADSRPARRLQGGAIVAIVDAGDRSSLRRKAREVLDVVQAELGAVEIGDSDLWGTVDDSGGRDPTGPKRCRYRAFLYLVGTKCVGLCLAKRIARAHATSEQPKEHGMPSEVNASAIRLSEVSSDAFVGISRIWTSKSHRSQGVARALLDSVSQSFDPGGRIPRSKIAFSQPTTSGAALARRWYGRDHGWLVYLE